MLQFFNQSTHAQLQKTILMLFWSLNTEKLAKLSFFNFISIFNLLDPHETDGALYIGQAIIQNCF